MLVIRQKITVNFLEVPFDLFHIYYTMFTRLTRKGLDICPLPANVRNSCFRGGAGVRGGK